jgi:hypothetical protein
MSPVVGPSGPGSDSPMPLVFSMTSSTGLAGRGVPVPGAGVAGDCGVGAACGAGVPTGGSGLTFTGSVPAVGPPAPPPAPPGPEASGPDEPAPGDAATAPGSEVSAPTMSASATDWADAAGAVPRSGRPGPAAAWPSAPSPPNPPPEATAAAATSRMRGARSDTPVARAACLVQSLTMAMSPW